VLIISEEQGWRKKLHLQILIALYHVSNLHTRIALLLLCPRANSDVAEQEQIKKADGLGGSQPLAGQSIATLVCLSHSYIGEGWCRLKKKKGTEIMQNAKKREEYGQDDAEGLDRERRDKILSFAVSSGVETLL
jgi:hypothetical protein